MPGRIKRGQITSKHIKDGTLAAADLAAGLVTGNADGVTLDTNGAGSTLQIAADGVVNSKIADGAVSIENIDSGAAPIKHVVGGGIFTTLGGDANESITATGCLGTDTAIVWVQKAGAVAKTVDTITPGTGSIAVVMSGDPSTDHKLGWLVLRAAS